MLEGPSWAVLWAQKEALLMGALRPDPPASLTQEKKE